MSGCAGINLLRKRQPLSASFGEADELFEPSGAGCFHMKSGTVLFDEAIDDRIDRKLVAPGVDAEFERVGQPEFTNGKRDDAQVFIKFLLELRKVADVINALVEASGELRRDRLRRDTFSRDHCEDEQQLGWRLRRVGFVHRHFGDKSARPLSLCDMPIDAAGFLHGPKELPRRRTEQCFVNDQR